VRKLPPYGYCDIPKREKTQPILKTFAQLSLFQIIGEISAQNSTWAGRKGTETIASLGRDCVGRNAGNTAIIVFGRRVLFLPLRGQGQPETLIQFAKRLRHPLAVTVSASTVRP